MKLVATIVSIAFVCLTMSPQVVRPQAGHTAILVGTGDAETGNFLSGVQVRISALNLVSVTDSMGRTRLEGVRKGTYTIEARRVGYAPLTAPVLVRAEDSLEVILLLRSTATRLDTVVVASRAVTMHLREFETRRARGTGQFVTGAQIDSVPGASLKAILEARVRGVTAVGGDGGMHVMTGRQATEDALVPGSGGASACWPVIYVDGVQLADDTGRGPDIGFVSPASIGGIEFYAPSEVPAEYRSSGVIQNQRALGAGAIVGSRGGGMSAVGAKTSPSCGVMLIWSRG